MAEEPLRIIYLQAENVKRLKAVRINPDKTLVCIEGKNAAGKSSVLDAIAAAIGGGKQNPEMPIRKGQRKASVQVDLGTDSTGPPELKVERRWTATGGTTLVVTSADGVRMASPQAVLDKLLGDLTFDPLEFVHMKSAEQVDVLKRLAGLDFTDLETRRDKLYTERTVANREAKNAEARVGEMPPKPSGGPIDTKNLASGHEEALAYNRECDDLHRAATQAASIASASGNIVEGGLQEIADVERKLEELRAVLLENQEGHDTKVRLLGEAKKKADARKPVPVADLSAVLEKAQQHNDAIRARSEWEARDKDASKKAADAEVLTDEIEAIDDEKSNLLQDAKLPLDGLSIEAAVVTYNGVPFSQASSAEQLRTGVAIGLAGKPRARIMLCRNGSLLDAANLTALHGIAEEFDAQAFVERVADEASPAAVFIEDGEVVEAEATE